MSTIKVNRIEAYSGVAVEVVGLQATASNALWAGLVGIPSGLVSGSYSSSMSTRITAQENFSSSLDATFATDAELSSLSSSASTSRNQLATDYAAADTTLSGSASDARNQLATDYIAADTTLSGSASDSRNQLATDYQTADTTLSSSVAADISTNADDISTLNGKTLFSGSSQVAVGGDLSGTADSATVTQVQGVALTSGEATQLANINSETISNTQWGYLGALDQSLTTTSNITSSNLLVSNNLVVNGTASFAVLQSVTGSAKIIGDAYIILNNNTPTERYAGIKVQDSGSAGVTASLEFDGQTNDWFYEYSDDGGVTTDRGAVIFGPEYSTKGSPTYPTSNTIIKGNGDHHIVDSNITDNGSLITLGSNTSITGTVVASGTSLVSGSGQIVLQSADKTGFTGATSITTLGTIGTGTWQGSSISTTYTDAKVTSVVAGTLVDVSAGTGDVTVNVDLSELATSTSDGDGDYFVVVDTGNAQKKLTKGNINLSGFNNDLGVSALSVSVVSTSTTMVKNTAYVVSGTAGVITMTLPASPSNGDLIKFANRDGRQNIIGRNGSNIMGLAQDMTLDIEEVSFDLVYTGASQGWVIYGSRATA